MFATPGLGDYEKSRTQMLARRGYNVFAVDIYGKGIRPSNPQDASVEAAKYKDDRALLRSRVRAGLETLLQNELTDPERVAAIGYCFGGTTVLELARSGANIAGVVDWQLIAYGGAVHSFTDWDAGTDNSKGAAYNERADRRSWEAMKQFFAECFK